MALAGHDTSPRTAIVLYGTETGTSQDLAFETCRILEKVRFEADVQELDNVIPGALSQYSLVVLVLSTTGQGEFPSNARKFWTSLLRKKLTNSFLSQVQYALFGLGDTSYPKFNWAARKLHKRLQQLGANSLMEPCEADEQGEDSTDGAFIAWSSLFVSMLTVTYPLPEGIESISDDTNLASKWKLALHSDYQLPLNGSSGNGVSNHQSSRSMPLKLSLIQNERVTPSDHWQDVRFLKFKSNVSVEYLPGDCIEIQPQNMPDDVQQIINLMEWDAVADEKVHLKHNRGSSLVKHQLADVVPVGGSYTLRQLLQNNLDINAIPRRSFFTAIARFTDNEMHKGRLLEFTDPQYLDEYYDYATRPRRSILEILQEFDSVQIPWEEAINVFQILRPRQFSIASGGLLKQGGIQFELLVAIVRYKTVIKRIREGVCTRYLAQMPVGTVVDATLKIEGRLHSSSQLQHIHHLLIGAGTGIAPLRAIIYEKLNNQSSGTNTLIFGSRNKDADYFFRDEWEKFAQEDESDGQPRFDLITAFSRDQDHKIYVQNQIKAHAKKVRTLVMGLDATVVVCGSSGQMPKSVRQALAEVLSTDTVDGYESMTMNEAEKFLDKLEKAGRYKQETW